MEREISCELVQAFKLHVNHLLGWLKLISGPYHQRVIEGVEWAPIICSSNIFSAVAAADGGLRTTL